MTKRVGSTLPDCLSSDPGFTAYQPYVSVCETALRHGFLICKMDVIPVSISKHSCED